MATKVLIVGGGVIGTMHAREAVRRGHDVVHIEADAGPRRASVRNFGLVWVSGRAPGVELDLAVRARTLWEEVANEAPGVGFRPDGSLTLARHESELALLTEAAAQPDAAARGFELLDPDAVRAANPALGGEMVGGLLCTRDAVVEPGHVLGAVRASLENSGRYAWLPSRQIVDVESGPEGTTAIDHLGVRHDADLAVLCIGDRLAGIGGRIGTALTSAPIRKCRLQMMQTAPFDRRLTTAVADADSMRYYPAFDLPGRANLPEPSELTSAWGMQLLMVQRATGGLTIGDTHLYDQPFDFAVEEHLYDDLAARAEAALGVPLPPIVRRWAGVYTGMTDERTYYCESIDPGITVVTAPAGRGMTLSPAIAEQTWKALNV